MGPGLDKTKTGAAQKHRAQHLQYLSQYNILRCRIPQLGSVYDLPPRTVKSTRHTLGFGGQGSGTAALPDRSYTGLTIYLSIVSILRKSGWRI